MDIGVIRERQSHAPRRAVAADSSNLVRPRCAAAMAIDNAPSDALNREVTYSDIAPEDWERELKKVGSLEHLARHLVTMAALNRAGRYDRLADGVERVTGRPAMSVRESVSLRADEFGGRRSRSNSSISTFLFRASV